MILGRSPNLVLGFLTAAFNAVVLFHIGGFTPDAGQIAGVNILLGAGIALVANTSSIQIAAGRAAEERTSN